MSKSIQTQTFRRLLYDNYVNNFKLRSSNKAQQPPSGLLGRIETNLADKRRILEDNEQSRIKHNPLSPQNETLTKLRTIDAFMADNKIKRQQL